MFDLSEIVLGIIALSLGLGFLLLTLLFLRLMPKLQPLTKSPSRPPVSLDLPLHSDAVLLIQSGGRISYLNEQARELFSVWEEEPNLESLARRARPSEAFLTLCASEGQARFSLNGRFVEGTSYYAPGYKMNGAEEHDAILVALRRPQLVIESDSHLAAARDRDAASHPADISPQALTIFTELSQSMASSLDLETTLQTVLESVERLFPSDFLEVTLWDSEHAYLVPYRLVGLLGLDRRLEKGEERYRANEGYSGYLITHQKPLLVEDVNTFREARPMLDRQRYPFQSFLGMPLLIAGDLIGTLELASLTKKNYTEGDQEALRLLSGQAAIAINNAILYKGELQRSVELAGLANLAQIVSSIRDPQDLYTRLIENIAPLLPIDVLGFLIFDENRRVLEGQLPFIGVPATAIEWHQTIIQPGSQAEGIWQRAETIVTTNAPDDARFEKLELHNLARAAGIRHAVLAPLNSGGAILGFILAANKRDGSAFDQNDLRFLTIIAGQAAPIIENAALVQQSRHRAQRAETLRRIASLTSSSATLEEILKFSILDLARLLQADAAAVFMLDEEHGELRLHKESTFGIEPAISGQLGRIPTDDPHFDSTVTGSKRQFIAEDLAEAGEILPNYQTLADGLNIRSVISVPLIIRERGMGELTVGSLRRHFFAQGDIQTAAAVAGQLSAAIERSTLYLQTDQSLRQRVEQLTALTRIGRELNTTLELPHLLQRVYDEVLRTTRADCGTILLFELSETESRLPQAGPRMAHITSANISLHFGDTPGPQLHPLEQLVLLEGEPVIVHDFNAIQNEADRAIVEQIGKQVGPDDADEQELLYPAHSGVRSAMVVPIAYQGQVAGLIHLHAKKPNHFDESDREISEALAIQTAVALGNASRYQEQIKRTELLNRRVETLSKLFEVSQVLQKDQPLERSLESIAYAIQAATSFDTVLISVYQPENNQLLRVAGAGISLPVMAELQARPQPWESVKRLLRDEFCLGRVYFIPSERSESLSENLQRYSAVQDVSTQPIAVNRWRSKDILITPLFRPSGEPLGLISMDAPRDNLRPDRFTVETIEIFSSQAALIVESQQKMHSLQNQVAIIEAELELARKSAEQAQSHLPTLLHKDLEQTLAIQHLSQQARRINAGLDIAGIISQQRSWAEVLQALGQETLMRMEFDVALVAEKTADGGMDLAHALGAIPEEVNPKALLGQRNPLRHSLQTGELILVSNLSDETEWQNAPLLRALDAKSFFCMPIRDVSNRGAVPAKAQTPGSEEAQHPQALAALLAISRTPVAPFTPDDAQLYDLLARQVGIALQNLNLLDETTHRLGEVNLLLSFSRQLGSLDPSNILQALVESALSAVPLAQGAMVAMWNPHQDLLIPQAASGYADNFELMQVFYQPGEGLPGQVFVQRYAARVDEVDFARHYNLSPENLKHYRNATSGELPMSSLAVPIMAGTIRESAPDMFSADSQDETTLRVDEARSTPLGILVLDNAAMTAAFTEDDLAVITSLAQQTALTLENARLYQSSVQRSSQLQALTSVSATVTSSLQTEELVATLLDQLQEILPYDTGTLWLRQQADETQRGGSGYEDRMIIGAAKGFADSDQRLGLTVDVQDSQLLNEMIKTGQPIWVADVRKDARFQTLQLDEDLLAELGEDIPNLPTAYERLSWLGVPLIASGQVIGVIALEKSESQFYTPDDIQVATAFAAQAATGLVNANLYQESVNRAIELDQRSQTLTILNRLSGELSGSLDATEILELVVREFVYIMPCTSASALLVKQSLLAESKQRPPTGVQEQAIEQVILQAEYPNESLDSASRYTIGSSLPVIPLFERMQETRGIFNTEDVRQEPDLAPLEAFLARHYTHSLLIVPIISGAATEDEMLSERRFHGMLLAHNSQAHRFSADELELARTISNQVAIALQNARLTEDLELRVQQRTAELGRERQRAETLLRIITELSASLDLDQVLHSTLQVLSEYVDADQITILITRPGDRKLHRLASVGYAAEPADNGSPTPLDIDQGLAGWIISYRQSVLIEDVIKDERWVDIPHPNEEWLYQHRSALGVPLMSGAEALGCLLLFSPDVGHFSVDQLDLVQAAANQVAIAVNNAELYRLIRDQAEDLGSMLRSQQIETSRSKAILEAVADGVLVTDADRVITLFNESAENILGLKRSQVLGKSMEHFSGLFGRATKSWMETIRSWSDESGALGSGGTFAEQLTLEDGRVISVHLAPVSLRNDFLGTVSIFQDITHQVEVDRLKSEFVATVSHELRTPMTSIKGYVEVLLMGAAGKLTEQQVHFLQVVKTNTERLAVLVNDLLDISQIESGKIQLSLQPLNLEEIASQALSELERRIRGDVKSIRLHKEIQAGLPRILGDPERVRRIFDNLLDNAYQYNSPGGEIFVRIHQSQQEKDKVQIDIQDTGVGIHPADQPRVFERFYRGESPLALGVSGTGLGLSIVQNLVEMQNGRIWVTSSGISGEGSTFSFTLPIYNPEVD
ncbi:MAG: GAF domain-containing protein [Anaerolineales bacterium]|nr:GAF domain-containing protein [Anaerolineales bacterium]